MTMTRSTKSKKQKRDKAAEKRADIMRQIELGDKIVAYSNAARPHTEFKVGDRVYHNDFGPGTIEVIHDFPNSIYSVWVLLDKPLSLGNGVPMPRAWTRASLIKLLDKVIENDQKQPEKKVAKKQRKRKTRKK